MNKAKRLALYIFYDKDGFVSEYVKYYIKALREAADRVVFIANGLLDPDGKKEIEAAGAEIFQRENKGLDFGAWKDAILSIGFPKISSYDELILCNCSTYGPVYPLSEVFSEMESRSCDFWGITKHQATGDLIIRDDPSSAIIEHIQSYFIVFTKKVTSSACFRKWWNGLKPSSDYKTEVAFHENRFTEYLCKNGFTGDTYVSCDRYFSRGCRYNPTSAFADEIIRNDRDPFVKRKLFINEESFWSNTGEGFTPLDVIETVKETGYPVEYIYSDLLRNHKISELKDTLALTWIHRKTVNYSKRKLALVCYAYYTDLAGYMCSYLLNMPEGSDLYLISSKQEVLDAYKKILKRDGNSKTFGKITFLLKPNRGRDVASLLVTFAPYVMNYDAFCFVHDKKSKQNPYTLTRDFLRRSLVCCLESREYTRDLVEALFDEKERCGVMLPPTPYFSLYITLGAELYEEGVKPLRSLFDRLKLKVPLDEKLMAPFGTMFWARTDALADLFSYDWHYDDFPEEPMPIDHTISHEIERIFCFCAQNRGYFSKWAMPESFAELYVNNLSYRLRDYNAELNRIIDKDSWYGQLSKLKAMPSFNSNPAAAPAGANKTFRYSSYLRYKLLSKITFGHLRKHYRKKYQALKAIKRARRIKFF